MNRLTRTKLEKLLYTHNRRVDQIIDVACSELDAIPQKAKPIHDPTTELKLWKKSVGYTSEHTQRNVVTVLCEDGIVRIYKSLIGGLSWSGYYCSMNQGFYPPDSPCQWAQLVPE